MKNKGIYDSGRFLLGFAMAFGGAFLLGKLAFHVFGVKPETPYWIKISDSIPFMLFGFVLCLGLFKAFQRLREKCENEWSFWMIMLSFSMAGMFIMPVRKFIFHLLGITAKTSFWIKVLIYIPIIPPTYYVGLMFFGTLLGQKTFFWGMISKRLAFLTGRKNIKH